jgi:tripeptide aminopeptidase
VRPASEAERARLADTFAELCRIQSPFGRERACADRVAAELRGMGLAVEEDDAAAAAGAECGNLLARIPGRSERTILLCAHLDTVDTAAPVDPVLVDGGWENANDGILGADNKAAVAVMLAVARRASVEGAPVGIELLFTVSEENALAGAKAFDASVLRSEFGYVFDHASPIGEVVLASPTYFRLSAEFHGAAAHAGIRPRPAAARSSPPPARSPRCPTAGWIGRRRRTSGRSPVAWARRTSSRVLPDPRRGAVARRRSRRGGRRADGRRGPGRRIRGRV